MTLISTDIGEKYTKKKKKKTLGIKDIEAVRDPVLDWDVEFISQQSQTFQIGAGGENREVKYLRDWD